MPKVAHPWFILIAGVNGSGKSTFATPSTLASLLEESDATSIEVINPDTETRRILTENPQMPLAEANLKAAKTCEALVRKRIRLGQGHFAIETVLSTDKYRPVVNQAIRSGWHFLFVYIVLDSVDESIRRVAFRVSRGGHDVPIDKLRKRWSKSRENMPWFWHTATSAFLFRNPPDFGVPREVAHKHDDRFVTADWPPHPAVKDLLPAIISLPN